MAEALSRLIPNADCCVILVIRHRHPMVHVGAQKSDEGTSDYFKKMILMGRLGTADELASAAVFLVSEESSFITGIGLPVDGGTVSR